MSNKSLWSKQSERWKNVGSPTRPGQEDESIFEDLVLSDLVSDKQKRVIVAGVTPELINHLAWPSNVTLDAFDASADMIQQNWNPPSSLSAKVTQADWRSLPLEDHSIDLIIGDGIFTALGDAEKMIQVLKEFQRVLHPNGSIVIRNFIQPDVREQIEEIVANAKRATIENFGTLKWRLATSLTDEKSSVVQPEKIHATFQQYFNDREALSETSGWTLEQIATIDSYKEMTSSFYFPTLDELKQHFSVFFHLTEIRQGSYEWAEYCPIISLNSKKIHTDA